MFSSNTVLNLQLTRIGYGLQKLNAFLTKISICNGVTLACLCDFGSGSLWAPLGIVWLSLGKLREALGSQDGARMAPDGAKMVQDEAKMAQDGARMAQDVGQTSPEESRQQNKKKSIHPNSRSSSFAGSILI